VAAAEESAGCGGEQHGWWQHCREARSRPRWVWSGLNLHADMLVTLLYLHVPDDAHGDARGSVLQHEEAWAADLRHGGGGLLLRRRWLAWLVVASYHI
jgi:hypothetical protein